MTGRLLVYGLINKAMREMVREEFGEARWEDVISATEVPADSFLTMRCCDDAVTETLTAAVGRATGMSREACLERFGRYWMRVSGPRHYGDLMAMAGGTPLAFLENLDALHDRIRTTFVDYRPPRFAVEEASSGRFAVRYRSHRRGLTPFVRGLLMGIGERFACPVVIEGEHSPPVADGALTVFTVRIGERS